MFFRAFLSKCFYNLWCVSSLPPPPPLLPFIIVGIYLSFISNGVSPVTFSYACLNHKLVMDSVLPISVDSGLIRARTSVLSTYWPSPVLQLFLDGITDINILFPLFYVVQATHFGQNLEPVTYHPGWYPCKSYDIFPYVYCWIVETCCLCVLLVRDVPLKSGCR